MPGFTIKIDTSQGKKALEDIKRSTDSFGSSLKVTPRTADSLTLSLVKMAKQVTALVGAYLSLNKAMEILGRGVEINASLEQSRIGIASVIASVSELKDAQGNVLKGTEAYNASLELAGKAMDKIRIMGLETTATTEDLVAGFQQLIGPASAANFTMEETLKFTTSMVQALGAIGIPFAQLSAEARSLLDGSIVPTQDRLATTLGITGDMVRNWKAQGVLVKELMARLENFALAGEDVAKTWAGVTSNLQDAFDVISANATKGLYQNLIKSALEFNAAIVDVDAGGASENIDNIVRSFERLSNALGEGIIDSTRELIKLLKMVNDNFDAITTGIATVSGAFAAWAIVNKTNLLPSLQAIPAALSSHVSGYTEAANAAREKAAAELQAAQAAYTAAKAEEEAHHKAMLLAKSKQDAAISSRQVQNAVAAEEAAMRQWLTAGTASNAALERLTQAQTVYAQASARTTAGQKALQVALGGLRSMGAGLLGMLGGPLGAAMTALGAATAFLASRQTLAQKAAELHSQALTTLNKLTSEASRQSKTLADNIGAVGEAQRAIALDKAAEGLAKIAGEIKLIDFSAVAGGFFSMFAIGPEWKEDAEALDDLIEKVRTGEAEFSDFAKAAADVYKRLRENGYESSNFGKILAEVLSNGVQKGLDLERVVAQLRGEINAAGESAEMAGKKIEQAFDPEKLKQALSSLDFRVLYAGLGEGVNTEFAKILQGLGKSSEEIKNILSTPVDQLPQELKDIQQKVQTVVDAEQAKKAASRTTTSTRTQSSSYNQAENDAKEAARALADLEIQTNRLLMSDKDFREWELVNVTLPKLKEETHGATEAVQKYEAAQRAAWEKEDKAKNNDALKERASLLQDIGEMSGNVNMSIQAQNDLLHMQADAMRASLGPAMEEYINEWERLQKLQLSTDPIDGAIRGLKSYHTEAMNLAKQLENFTTNSFSSMEDALVQFVTTGKFSFTDMVNSMIADLVRMSIRAAVLGPIANALSGAFGGFFGGGGGAISGTAGAYNWSGANASGLSLSFAAKGNVFSGGDISSYSNSVVTEPTFFGYGTHVSRYARGAGLMGEAGPEAVMPLVRSSGGYLGVRAVGNEPTPQVTVNLINQSGQQLQGKASATPSDQGGWNIEVVLDQIEAGLVKRDSAGRSSLMNHIDRTRGTSRAGGLYR